MSPSPAPLRADAAVIALVGAAHFSSHFLQLALAPLFPLVKAELDVGLGVEPVPTSAALTAGRRKSTRKLMVGTPPPSSITST